MSNLDGGKRKTSNRILAASVRIIARQLEDGTYDPYLAPIALEEAAQRIEEIKE